MLDAIGNALWLSLAMGWQIFWGLSLGFAFAAVIEVLVAKDTMSSLLPDSGPRSVAIASAMGAASSSCSYAAVAMTRSIVRKGGNFTAAMCFQFAATNLVLELGILLWVLMAWQFAAAEFVGGGIMIVLLAVSYSRLLPRKLEKRAVEQAEENTPGAMEGHAAMAMESKSGSWESRLLSRKGWVAISHSYIMNWAMVWKDIALGLLVAGALGAWVPDSFWQAFFLDGGNPWLVAVWSAVIGPLIALAAFTCSIGNVPLAVVLWNGGIGFGGVIAFIFGDLIIPPLLNIYRKYYGGRMTVFLLISFYLLMVVAALCVEGLFVLTGLVPDMRQATAQLADIKFNYTSILDIIFGLAALTLFVVFLRTGGPKMMRQMAGNKGR